jgi:CRP-like cAMP-binding protein
MTDPPFIKALARNLESHTRLDEADLAALAALPHVMRSLDPGQYLVREGDRPEYCSIMVSGFSYRHKVTGDGARQIMSVHLPGEFIDLHNLFLDISDHNVQALTRSDVAFVPRAAVREASEAFPNLGRAMWTSTLIDASIFREWTMNVGRRDSLTRIAHLLCELALRMEQSGLGANGGYELPMTQEQLADAAGLTPVHVNRVLKELGRRGLIERQRRSVSIPDWPKLREIGDFNARYLHLDQAMPDPAGLPRAAGGAILDG